MSKLKWFSSRLAVACAQSTEAKCQVDNEDVVGAAPTGDAPTTSELSKIFIANLGAFYIRDLTVVIRYIRVIPKHDHMARRQIPGKHFFKYVYVFGMVLLFRVNNTSYRIRWNPEKKYDKPIMD